MRDKIRASVKECKKVGGFDELKKEIEESTGMKLDDSQMFEDANDLDLEYDYDMEDRESEIDQVTKEKPDLY